MVPTLTNYNVRINRNPTKWLTLIEKWLFYFYLTLKDMKTPAPCPLCQYFWPKVRLTVYILVLFSCNLYCSPQSRWIGRILHCVCQACPFRASDVRDYPILVPDLPLLHSISPTDLPSHISGSTGPTKCYDLSIHTYILWQSHFSSQN